MPVTNVLLVDDHPLMQEVLGAVAQRVFEGVRIHTATDFAEVSCPFVRQASSRRDRLIFARSPLLFGINDHQFDVNFLLFSPLRYYFPLIGTIWTNVARTVSAPS